MLKFHSKKKYHSLIYDLYEELNEYRNYKSDDLMDPSFHSFLFKKCLQQKYPRPRPSWTKLKRVVIAFSFSSFFSENRHFDRNYIRWLYPSRNERGRFLGCARGRPFEGLSQKENIGDRFGDEIHARKTREKTRFSNEQPRFEFDRSERRRREIGAKRFLSSRIPPVV